MHEKESWNVIENAAILYCSNTLKHAIHEQEFSSNGHYRENKVRLYLFIGNKLHLDSKKKIKCCLLVCLALAMRWNSE